MPNHHIYGSDQVDQDHGAVEHMDAAATLPEREPVRIYGTMPATILGTAGTIIGLGMKSSLMALGCASVIVVVSAILELVRARVSPPVTGSLAALAPHISRDHAAGGRRRVLAKRRGPRHARKNRRAPSPS